jgi:K+-sensing histidine kinase KdpD
VTKQDVRKWLPYLVAVAVPPGLAAALIPIRAQLDPTNVALVLVVVVVAVACFGSRMAAAVAALCSAAWFDFFHTRPYLSFTINKHEDLVTAGLLLVTGLVVGELAVRAQQHKAAAVRGSNDIARIHGVAELVAAGEPADFVVMAVATELRDLLDLADCSYDPDMKPDPKPLAEIERSGAVHFGQFRWAVDHIGLPGKQVVLPIQSGGRKYGRYLLQPTPGHPLDFDLRVVAVALADQVGAALAGTGARVGR